MKFLVVDDDPAILKITEKLITLSGHDVVFCDNALEAIQTLADLSFDILITDATMPSYSGFDLIRSIRKKSDLEYLTIAMLTGRNDKSDIQQALQLGVQDYIVKPITPDLFIEKINKLVASHKNKKVKTPNGTDFNSVMNVPIEVVRVTDVGISIESPYPLAKGTLVTIDFPLLKKAGLTQNKFKSIFNSNLRNSNRVITELVLLDLNPSEQAKLSQLAENWEQSKAS